MDKNPHTFEPEAPLTQASGTQTPGTPAPEQTPGLVFRTPSLPCPYLGGNLENRIAVDLTGPHASARYDVLSQAGFRRTGRFAYRPDCLGCAACVSVRVQAAAFQASRSHRRVESLNADLVASERPAMATEEQFWLFRRYQLARHRDGEMARMNFFDYATIVEEGLPETRLIEFRKKDGTLLLAGLIDWLGDGPSAVYSFFDPRESQRSLGSYLILWLIERARIRNLPHVYLGYWIAECRKMTYKTRFRPLEGFGEDGWQPIDI